MLSVLKAFQNMRRTPYQSFAAIMVLVNTFFVGVLVVFTSLGLIQVLEYFESQPQMIVFFSPTTPESDIIEIQTRLSSREDVSEVLYISQEDALEIYREANKDDPQLLELVTAEILPASLEVSTNSIDSLGIIKSELEVVEGVDEIDLPEDVIDRLKTVLTGVRLAGGAFVGVMVFTSFLIITVVVGMKIANRQFEIKVMRLMGASSWYIQAPYLIEGALYGLISSNVAFALVVSLIMYASPHILAFAGDLPLLPKSYDIVLYVYGINVLAGVLIGMIGSILSVVRFNRS